MCEKEARLRVQTEMQQMNDAINDTIGGTARNSNAVEFLCDDADLATLIAKTDELITAQRR